MDTKKIKWFLIFTFLSSCILQIIAGENEARGLGNVIKLRKRKKVTGTVKVSVTFIMSNFMNRM